MADFFGGTVRKMRDGAPYGAEMKPGEVQAPHGEIIQKQVEEADDAAVAVEVETAPGKWFRWTRTEPVKKGKK